MKRIGLWIPFGVFTFFIGITVAFIGMSWDPLGPMPDLLPDDEDSVAKSAADDRQAVYNSILNDPSYQQGVIVIGGKTSFGGVP